MTERWMGGAAPLDWVSEHEFTCADVPFWTPYQDPPWRPEADVSLPASSGLQVQKPPSMLESYPRLIDAVRPERVLELGYRFGGSMALIAACSKRPVTVVGVDKAPTLPPRFERFAAHHGFADAVSMHPGVDQADQARLTEIVAKEFGGQPIDLVIDDASHALSKSRASFRLLFPLLRPGGQYVIEDWAVIYHLLKGARQVRRNRQEQHRNRIERAKKAAQMAVALTLPSSSGADRGRRRLPPILAAADAALPLIAPQLLADLIRGRNDIAAVNFDRWWITIVKG